MAAAGFDLAVVGGGINGTAIARDAAGRGLSVLLVEQNDLASGTSSASTKLIHGGLRYLEHGWFRLVREALIEREVMLRMAPHLVRPTRFVLPVEPGMRPMWMLRLGLLIYDHLGGRRILPPTRNVDFELHHGALGAPLKRHYAHGLEFSDCGVRRLITHGQGYLAQRFVPKPSLEIDGVTLRADLRVWAYRGEIFHFSGRASGRPDRLELTPPAGCLPTYASL
jgi:hypothetical protein